MDTIKNLYTLGFVFFCDFVQWLVSDEDAILCD